MTEDPNRLETIPVLPSLNIKHTEAFYCALGFETDYAGPEYVLLRKDEVELHLWLCDDADLCKNTSCYIRDGKIDQWHEEFIEIGPERLSPLKLQPWNMYEFHVFDPDGVLLRFGRSPGEFQSKRLRTENELYALDQVRKLHLALSDNSVCFASAANVRFPPLLLISAMQQFIIMGGKQTFAA